MEFRLIAKKGGKSPLCLEREDFVIVGIERSLFDFCPEGVTSVILFAEDDYRVERFNVYETNPETAEERLRKMACCEVHLRHPTETESSVARNLWGFIESPIVGNECIIGHTILTMAYKVENVCGIVVFPSAGDCGNVCVKLHVVFLSA